MSFPNAAALGLTIALGLGVAACGGNEGDGVDAAGPTESAADLLAVDASTVGGSDYSLAQHADSDLVIWFWAPW